MSDEQSKPWTTDERVLLDRLLDTIVPAGREGQLPAAGALGVGAYLADRVADTEGLGVQIADLLNTLAGVTAERGPDGFQELDAATREELAQAVEAKLPDAFKALVIQTYMGYYIRPEVTVHFGTGPKPPQPDGHDLPPDDPDELSSLLETVRARGKCYREC